MTLLLLLTGHHLIAFIRAWQDTLIQVATQNGTPAFRFNTYIISVLVIFFYQIDQKFPKVSTVPPNQAKSIDNVPPVNVTKFKNAVRQFFQFYGKIYGMNHKIISINIGQLEDRFLKQYQQIHSTPEQKRFVRITHENNFQSEPYFGFCSLLFLFIFFSLRDGIKSNASHWRNSSMFVQDIKSPGVNITVDVPEKEAENFQQMCRMFESVSSIGKAVDEYLLKVHQNRPASVVDLTIDLDSDEPPPAKRAALENHTTGSSNTNNNNNNRSEARSVDISPTSDATQTLTNVVMSNKNQIFQGIPSTAVDFVSRTVRRISDERDIVRFLTSHLKTHSTTLQTIPFGSSTYGFGGSDFNILVNTSTTKNSRYFKSISFNEFFDPFYFQMIQKTN